MLLAFGATALRRADRDPIENWTQAIVADAIALALFVSDFRRKRRAKTSGRDASPGIADSLHHREEQKAAKSPPAPTATSLENELRSLAVLKADGILSEEEFIAKKRALLDL